LWEFEGKSAMFIWAEKLKNFVVGFGEDILKSVICQISKTIVRTL
jgi:hypothetical protein